MPLLTHSMTSCAADFRGRCMHAQVSFADIFCQCNLQMETASDTLQFETLRKAEDSMQSLTACHHDYTSSMPADNKDLYGCRHDLLNRQLCNTLQEETLKVMQQQQRLALLASAGCAPYSVNILCLVCRHPNLNHTTSGVKGQPVLQLYKHQAVMLLVCSDQAVTEVHRGS